MWIDLRSSRRPAFELGQRIRGGHLREDLRLLRFFPSGRPSVTPARRPPADDRRPAADGAEPGGRARPGRLRPEGGPALHRRAQLGGMRRPVRAVDRPSRPSAPSSRPARASSAPSAEDMDFVCRARTACPARAPAVPRAAVRSPATPASTATTAPTPVSRSTRTEPPATATTNARRRPYAG